ncbi:arginine--tRNA ligase [Sphingomonas melonis TY]|jgi:arginyl-tRNA synthetase|uniref:Arginine--tRNA ligase n=1 Tax=Sphingomonas melonis TY TaxID=621456 RepID=A0A175Y7A0_9SPHN|nr:MULTISPECIES: arginine--tRNA ligase [Sphingomonas]ATI55289.1 arginine--tRNA ligase [Sphingomonas melonis]KZB96355.1 arginine--tRNA ligase [Sphingomonas melonis TY]MBI0531519.1 arginine--tRNA ligase [Sphingomonas sp. TX0522]MBX8843745.1 arginine--tRNA ligase [Sphingomonas melonis]MBX8853367.1 arginine--tRNA ligase [Sphingomonas melonis]
MTLYTRFAAHVAAALDTLVAAGTLPADLDRRNVTVEPPRDVTHGDLATNAAMVLAKPAKTNPRALAEALAAELGTLDEVAEATVAGPGFINLRLTDAAWRDELTQIAAAGDDYGRSTSGKGVRVNVEYVSANPTGPMHMGHCRGAVVGDALASLLEFAGHDVIREYYVNDAGGQVDVLARSAHLRYREALGEDVGAIPEGLYPGDYLVPVGKALADEFGDRYATAPEGEWLALFRARAVAAMLVMIKDDLALLGIHHDLFSSEAELQAAGKPEAAEKWLREHGLVYDGVLEAPKGETPEDWEPVELPLFRSTQFGDDQDRPIKKSNGQWTYFGADLAYHFQKSQSADQLIDIWGADHAGTVKRIQAAVAALTEGKTRFDVKLVQMVRLLRGGEPVKMSKRAGNFVTLADVVREVGKDVVRFTMLTRRSDAQMDFDFAKVVEASKDNPVFYVQYAHARVASLHRRAEEAGIAAEGADLSRLDTEELALVKLAAQFPRIVETAATAREPHRIAFYLYDLAAAFHALWNVGNDRPERRFLVVEDHDATRARLALASAVAQIIRNGLSIMGVVAVSEMK